VSQNRERSVEFVHDSTVEHNSPAVRYA
jgi:hypothetical protein